MSELQFANEPAPGIPYFTPAQIPPAGTAVVPQPDGKPVPKLFQPLTVRGVTFQNRIWLSPLCQYSAKNGVPTPWHMAHLGGIASRGPGLTMFEATAVSPEGRITPEDLGLWSDEHIPAFAEIATFIHSQGQKVAIQLAHAGRKASTVAPWLSFHATATEAQDGWPADVVAPSAIKHSEGFPDPKELSLEGVRRIRQAFVDAAARAVKAGIDVIEIHAAHGYLLHEFASPIANYRTDEYGGSFENRVRLHLEIVEGIRAVIPKEMPLIMRISATDCLETVFPDKPSWRLEDSIRLAGLLADRGVDVLDVSSAGNHPDQAIPHRDTEAAHAAFSRAIKAAHGDRLLVATVGNIRNGRVAQRALDENAADLVFVGRQFQKNPGTVWAFAEDLGITIHHANQIAWGFFGRGAVSRAAAKKQ